MLFEYCNVGEKEEHISHTLTLIILCKYSNNPHYCAKLDVEKVITTQRRVEMSVFLHRVFTCFDSEYCFVIFIASNT